MFNFLRNNIQSGINSSVQDVVKIADEKLQKGKEEAKSGIFFLSILLLILIIFTLLNTLILVTN